MTAKARQNTSKLFVPAIIVRPFEFLYEFKLYKKISIAGLSRLRALEDWLNKIWYVYPMGYCKWSSYKKEQGLSLYMLYGHLENILLNEKKQGQNSGMLPFSKKGRLQMYTHILLCIYIDTSKGQ